MGAEGHVEGVIGTLDRQATVPGSLRGEREAPALRGALFQQKEGAPNLQP